MGVTIVLLLVLAIVVGGGVWITKVLKPKVDEDVITVEPEPTPYQKTGVGKALAVVKPTKRSYESESPIDPGQAVVQLPQHTIGGTWIDPSTIYTTYHWRCVCGVSGWSVSQGESWSAAKKHCREYKRAEELKAQSNGRFSW